MDALKNFAYSLVATAPSPATSGTSLTVTAGQGSYFPATPFDATVWPANSQPSNTNAEIVRVTNVTGDVLTITRAQYGTTAQSIAVGYQIAQTVDANLLNQLAPLSGATFTGEVVVPDLKVTGLSGATAGSTRLVGVTTAGAPTTGTWQAGDVVADQTGTFWICLAAGTPGTWTNVIPNSLQTRSSTATAGVGEFTIFTGSTANQVITLPSNPVNGSTYQIKNLSLNTVYINGGLNNLSVSGNVYAPSFTATTTASSPTLTSVSSTSNLYVGQEVSGTYIPAGTTIVSINSGASTITLSANATTTATNQTIKANYAVTVNAAYTFTYNGTGTGGTWYAFVTTDLSAVAGVLPVANGGMGSYSPTPGAVVFGGTSGYTDTSSNGGGATGSAGSLLMSYGNIANGGPEWVNFQLHQSVQAVSTSNIAGTYVSTGISAANPNGTVTTGANTTNDIPLNVDTFTITATGAFVVDGYTVSAATGDRVLFAGQTNQAQNGVWLCTTTGTTGVSAVFCRDNDADTPAKLAASLIQVNQGTSYGGTTWQIGMSNTSAATLGTTAIPIYQVFSSKSIIPAANGGTGSTTYAPSIPPAANGFKAWTVDPSYNTQNFTVNAAALYFVAIYLVAGTTYSNASIAVQASGGSSITVGIYTSTGMVSGNPIATVPTTAINTNSAAFSTPFTPSTSGIYWLGLGCVNASGVHLFHAGGTNAGLINFGPNTAAVTGSIVPRFSLTTASTGTQITGSLSGTSMTVSASYPILVGLY